jgi:hypothetical protein
MLEISKGTIYLDKRVWEYLIYRGTGATNNFSTLDGRRARRKHMEDLAFIGGVSDLKPFFAIQARRIINHILQFS